MTDTKHIEVTISGATPLLLHRFGDEEQVSATSGARSSIATTTKTPREQAEASLYLDEDGTPIMPAPNLLRSITDGGAFFKSGRSKITTQESSLIPACIAIEELYVPIESREGWGVDTRPVRNPATGRRILRHRPVFNDWELSFTVELDESVIAEDLLRQIVDTAGTRIGLGDFRPATQGPFGRFRVSHWSNGA